MQTRTLVEKHHGADAWNEFKSKIRIQITNGLIQVTTNGETLRLVPLCSVGAALATPFFSIILC